MAFRLIIILITVFAISCKKKDQKQKTPVVVTVDSVMDFDKRKWRAAHGTDYPYRDAMLKNLMDSGILKNQPKDSIIRLLGNPDRSDKGHLFYKIEQQQMGILTLRVKTMVIKLSNDSIVEWVKIHGG